MSRLQIRRRGDSSPQTQTGRRRNLRAPRNTPPPNTPHTVVRAPITPSTRLGSSGVPLPVVRDVSPSRPSAPVDIPIPDYIARMGGNVTISGHETATFRNTIGAKNTQIPDGAVVYDPELHGS